MANNYSINEGTQTVMKSTDNTSVQTPHVNVDNVTGTLAEISNIVKGTTTEVENLAGGTVGIVTAGTVDTVGLRHADAYGSSVSVASGTGGADLHGAVAGSSIFVTDLVISVGDTAMQVSLHPGGTANTATFGPYDFAANGGAVVNFRTPRQVTSGSALVYTTNADGTVTIEIDGYIN